MKRTITLLFLALLALGVSSCTSASDDADTFTVHMRDNVFDEDRYTVPVGGTLTFVNDGRNPHNAIDAGGSFSTEDAYGDLSMPPGAETQITFDTPGTYDVFCSFHAVNGQGMVTTIKVEGDASAESSDDAASAEPVVAEATEFEGTIRSVPEPYPTIQSAVDAAAPGDMVLIEPGTYNESVAVSTNNLVIRGADRNRVILDGEMEREHGVIIVSDGVAVENLTTHSYLANGVFWTGVTGFRGSYLTSYWTGDYSIYAFDSSDGILEFSLGSGAPDAGFYVGQCDPCNTVVHNVISEYNGLGFSGTNASTEMYILNSVFRHNSGGMAPNTLDGEELAPQHDVTVIGNLVYDSGRTDVPIKNILKPLLGNGMMLAGINNGLIERNLVVNSTKNGINVTSNIDQNWWFSNGNVVRDNVILGSGRADLALAGPAGSDNCFEDNDFQTSLPVGLETFQPCEGWRWPVRFELAGSFAPLGIVAENSGNRGLNQEIGLTPIPEAQPTMPSDWPIAPAVDVFRQFDLDLGSIETPTLPNNLEVTQKRGISVFGLMLNNGPWSIFFGLWAYLMPFMLFAALLSITLWDLLRRDDLTKLRMLLWVAISLLVPFVGVIGYFIWGKSEIPGWQRGVIVGGGLGSYLVILVVGVIVGGIV